MRYYELLYIVNPNFEDEKVNGIIEEIGNEINKGKVSIINHHIWGKKRLAFPVKNNKYGIYLLLQFGAENFDFLVEFERSLILNKSVIRHQLVRLDNEPEKVESIEAVVKETEVTKDETADIPEIIADVNTVDIKETEEAKKTEDTEVLDEPSKAEEEVEVEESDNKEEKKEEGK